MEGISGIMARSAFSVGVARKALDAASQMALQLLSTAAPRIGGEAGAGSGQAYGPTGGLAWPAPIAAVKEQNLDTVV